MSKPKIIFMHKTTGKIRFAQTIEEGKKWGDDWTQIEFTKNEKGEQVTRFRFDNFTVDIQPNGTREVITDGDQRTK